MGLYSDVKNTTRAVLSIPLRTTVTVTKGFDYIDHYVEENMKGSKALVTRQAKLNYLEAKNEQDAKAADLGLQKQLAELDAEWANM